MSIPRNLGAFADNVTSTGTLNVTGINATGTPSGSTVLAGNGSWITPSAGAMTLISTATASTSATIDFTGLTSTYKSYVVIASNVVLASFTNLCLRTSTNNGTSYDSGASNYNSTYANTGNTTWSGGLSTDDRAYINTDNVDTTTNLGGISFTLTLVNPSAANIATWYTTGFLYGSNIGGFIGGGYRNQTTGAVNAIRFFAYSGNIKSGTFKLYGIS
jgi:hypothetical protein